MASWQNDIESVDNNFFAEYKSLSLNSWQNGKLTSIILKYYFFYSKDVLF